MSDATDSAHKPYVEYPSPIANETPQDRARRLVDWAKNCLFYTQLRRMRMWVLWRMADLFFDGDQTCISPDLVGYAGYELARLFPTDEIYLGEEMPSRPVLNEYKDAILNESSRLDKSDYEPTVRAEGDDPSYDQRLGAKIATRALRQGLEEMGWDNLKRLLAYHLPSYGGGWLVSLWDRSLEDSVRIPVDGALQCPECGTKYAGPTIDGNCQSCEDHATMRPPTPDEIAGRINDMPAETIPAEGAATDPAMMGSLLAHVQERQPGGPQLQQFVPDDSELRLKDPMGREFGEDVPRGSWKVEVPWPGEMFEAEFGFGTNGERVIRDVTRVRVRSLDYLRARYPNARTQYLKPELQTALIQFHPVGGEVANSDETNLWRNHAREITRIRMPWLEQQFDDAGQPLMTGEMKDTPVWKLNRGRVVTVAHGVALEDAPLMEEGPGGKLFPRILVTYTPHDVANGGQTRDGSSLGRQLMDSQRWVNFSAAMDIDEQKNGQSRWLASDAADVRFDSTDGNAMAIVRYHIPDDSANPGAYKPELISRPTADMKWGQAAEYARGYMERASRRTEVEGGEVPGPTTPAQAMQIAREESGAVRRPRVKGLTNDYRRIFSHGLQLMQRYVKEPRVAWDKTDSGVDFQSWYVGADFAGQTDVRIDIEGAEDSEVLRQQKYSDAIQQGLVDIQDPRQKRIMAKLKGVPEELFEVDDAQDVLAEREFLEYTRGVKSQGGQLTLTFATPPVVDDGLDNHPAHGYRHRKDLQSDLWREVERAVQWDTIIPVIAPWKTMVSQAMSSPADPTNPMSSPAGLDALEPTPQVYVFNVWMQLLQQAGAQVTPEQQGALAFRAHLAEHDLRDRVASMPPPQPIQAPAAPGQAAPAPAAGG